MWVVVIKVGEGLSGRKEKHSGDNLNCNGERMKVKAWPNEAAVDFLNRREMEDKE